MSKSFIVTLVVVLLLVGGGVWYLNYQNQKAQQAEQKAQQAQQQADALKSKVTPSVMMSNVETVALNEENKSGIFGTATLKEENGKVTVTITVTGEPQGAIEPAHIHVGVCPGVGAVKYPLTNVVNGTSTTTISATLNQLKVQIPLAINLHKSAQAITNYTACGELFATAKTMTTPVASPSVAPTTTTPKSSTGY